jgi:hypothetical protein
LGVEDVKWVKVVGSTSNVGKTIGAMLGAMVDTAFLLGATKWE